MGSSSRSAFLLPALCAGAALLVGTVWGGRYYFHNVQIPRFQLELVKDANQHADGSAKAIALNTAARIWLQDAQHLANPASEWFSVGWQDDQLHRLDGISQIHGDTLFFTPHQPVVQAVNLSVSAEGTVGQSSFHYSLTNSGTSCGPTQVMPSAAWMPEVASVPANALKFYLVFSQPMTQGGIFEHLKLEQKTDAGWKSVEGAFRESELWTPDLKRLTVWLHPGRQKSGVNLNEEEGPVLIAGQQYRLVLGGAATTQEGKRINQDVILSFTATEADHSRPDLQRWALKYASTKSVRLSFHKPLDWAMLASSIKVDGEPVVVEVDEDAQGVTLSKFHRWAKGRHVLNVNPELEDMAGNNFRRPFEVDVSAPNDAELPGSFQMEFEISY